MRIPENKEGNPDKLIFLGDAAWSSVARRKLASQSRWRFPSMKMIRLPRDTPRRLWERLKDAATLPEDLHIHDLRHTYASAALGIGFNLEQIGGILGHSSNSMTERYAYLLDDPRAEAARAIESHISGRRTS